MMLIYVFIWPWQLLGKHIINRRLELIFLLNIHWKFVRECECQMFLCKNRIRTGELHITQWADNLWGHKACHVQANAMILTAFPQCWPKKAFHFLNIDLVDCFLQLYKDLFVDCFLQLLIKIVRTQSFTSLTRRQDSSLIWNISLKEKRNNYMYSFLNLFSKAL